MTKSNVRFMLLFSLFLIIILSCEKEKFTSPHNIRLQFSSDTISFDTVFSTIGSVTKRLRVTNSSDHSIKIPKIFLAGGIKSSFRLNINGVAGNDEDEVYLSKGDSLYIFVEVTVDPTLQDAPMVVKDSIIFEMNGIRRDVKLIAFGQDFHLFNGEKIYNEHWKNDKPYLIYNSIIVDSLSTLKIDPGCRIHFHKGSSLFVQGTLLVQGTNDEPVTFSGDRLEEEYEDVPGQWGATETFGNNTYVYGGIHLLQGSQDNVVDHAIIENANKGIQVDSLGNSDNPMLILSNSTIRNMNLNCLDARTSNLVASNCIFANAGSYAVALRYGGKYELYHCTIANYSSANVRKEPAVIINNYFTVGKVMYAYDLENVIFANCIVDGESSLVEDEILLDGTNQAAFKYQFQNCILKMNPEFGDKAEFVNSIFNKDSILDTDTFMPDSLSAARNIGDIEIASQFPFDLNDQSRLSDAGPDVGALEWVSESIDQ